ncbi:hypothetical protein ACFPRL_29405 [Pseudoclavibacter helvolus]
MRSSRSSPTGASDPARSATRTVTHPPCSSRGQPRRPWSDGRRAR